MAAMTDVTCICGKVFKARASDVKRGWGRFCSKACKASAPSAQPAPDFKLLTMPDTDKSMAAIEEMRRHMPAAIERVRLLAQIRRAQYLALVEQGFTEQQAIEICKGQLA